MTWISPPGWRFSSATAPATSPEIRVELFHSTVSRVVETTYLRTRLSFAAIFSADTSGFENHLGPSQTFRVRAWPT